MVVRRKIVSRVDGVKGHSAKINRRVAQSGGALALGVRCREFKSLRAE